MRSKVAEELRQAQIEEIAAMSIDDRLTLARLASERAISFFMAGQRVDRETAIALIRRERQAGRRNSRCMIESL